jgi:hypothetical protein
MAGFVFSALASCAMESEQKTQVELRLDSPPSPDAIPLSDEEKATIQKHPDLKEAVAAWGNREFSLEFVGQTIVLPVERAYAGIREGQVVGVKLMSPNLTGVELQHLMTTSLRLWNASPEKVRKFDEWWRGNRESIVEMQIGDDDREVSVGVCPSFNREKPHVFKCSVWWKLRPSSSSPGTAETE